MSISRRTLLGLCVALAVLAASCGSDSSTADSTTADSTPDTESTTSAAPSSTTAMQSTTSVAPVATTAEVAVEAPSTGTVGSPALPVTFTNVDGSQTEVTDTSRIVVLNGDITEIVYELGLGEQVVAVDESAVWPEEAVAAPKVGYQRTLTVEGVIAFDPSVIVGTPDAGPPEVIAQLGDVGLPLAIVDSTDTLDAAYAKIASVAESLGVPVAGEELVARVSGEVDAALADLLPTDDAARTIMLFIRGADVQLIVGAGTAAGPIMEELGLHDVAAEAGVEGFSPLTPEALVELAPEILIVTTAGMQSIGGLEGFMQIPGVAETPAADAGDIFVYEDQLLLGFGPRLGTLFEQMVADLNARS